MAKVSPGRYPIAELGTADFRYLAAGHPEVTRSGRRRFVVESDVAFSNGLASFATSTRKKPLQIADFQLEVKHTQQMSAFSCVMLCAF
jgi:hypothetical protein